MSDGHSSLIAAPDDPRVEGPPALTGHDDRRPRTHPAVVALLACGLMLSLGLHISKMRCVTTLVHDDGISYMAATGHQGAFHHGALVGKWVPASDWKQYWRPEHFWCFRTIADDLGNYDIHPPLYFWCLHIWSYCLGTQLWSGPLLNTVFFTVTFFVLFGLLREVFHSSLLAAATVWLWSLSPQVIDVAMNARQYSLLTLITLAFTWALLQHTRASRPSWLATIVLALLTVAGMMTQYQFFVVIGLGTVLILLQAGRGRIGLMQAGRTIVSLACGVLASVALNPYFLATMSRQRVGSQPFELARLPARLYLALTELVCFAMPASPYGVYILLGALYVLLLVVLAQRTFRAEVWHRLVREYDRSALHLAFVGTGLAASIIGMYVLFITPDHAMGARYLGLVFPFVAFGAILLLAAMPRPLAGALIATLCVWQAWAGLSVADAAGAAARSQRKVAQAWSGFTGTVVLDNVARGVLPGVICHMPDDARVLAVPQDGILSRAVILPEQPETMLYVNDNRYGNTWGNSDRIRNRLTLEGYEVTDPKCSIFGAGHAYTAARKAPSTRPADSSGLP